MLIPSSVFEYRKKLVGKLNDLGYSIDNRFTPHLTVAREAPYAAKQAVTELNGGTGDISFRGVKAVLMKSERINGKLTYTPLYSV